LRRFRERRGVEIPRQGALTRGQVRVADPVGTLRL
jgi:hypothetical protein